MMNFFKNKKIILNEKSIDVMVKFTIDKFIKSKKEEFVIVNIGTDRCSGDCFGPLLGSILELNKYNFKVYGTLENPIHAQNIEEKLKEIQKMHRNAFILATDSSIGPISEIGKILLKNESIYPGRGVNKDLGAVGDIALLFVSSESDDEFTFLKLNNVRLGYMYSHVLKTLPFFEKLEFELEKELIS